MPNPVSAVSSSSLNQNKLRLKLCVTAGEPWPALNISAEALIGGERVPAARLKAERGAFVCEAGTLSLDSLDALIVRTLLQLPRSGDNFMAAARDFAPVLALLRQHSSGCALEEDERVAECEILTARPDCEVRIIQSGSGVEVRPIFRCSESGEELRLPLHRGATYWTFAHAIAPAPELPDDPLLRSALLADAPLKFSGNAATEMIFQAKQAARSGTCAVHMDGALATTKIDLEPLRQSTRISFDAHGRLVVARELATASGKSITLPEKGSGPWIEADGRLYRVPDGAQAAGGTRVLEGDDIADFLRDELPRFKQQNARIDAAVESACVYDALQPVLTLNESKNSAEVVEASCEFRPRGMGVSPMSQDSVASIPAKEMFEAATKGQRYLRKGGSFIRIDCEIIAQCQKRFSWAGRPCHELQGEQIPEVLSWAKTVREDVHTPWNVYVSAAVDGAHVVKDDPAKLRFGMDVDDEEGDTWFTLNPTFEHDGEGLTEDELRKLVRDGKKWMRKNKTWVKVDADALKEFELNVETSGVRRWRGRRKHYYYRFKPAQRDRITDIFSLSGTVEHAQRYQAFLAQLSGFDKIQPLPCPKDMALPLRPYQQQGFEWISFLAAYGLNGILADDMGLGKTAQTIAALTRMKDLHGPAPSLIVTPTSLSDNWRSEITKFNPNLRATIYRGSPGKRDRLRRELEAYDVVLATYATVRNDALLLREISWRHVILDEAHFIKNSAAATTKAIKTIPAKHRLALTGTPIQNRLTELWSLFDFLMPEFLGRQMRFRENFEEPIARMQSGRAETKDEIKTAEYALEKLRQRIAPFVLRRLKTDVATDLPPKIENDIFCGLSPEQLALYRGFADSAEAKTAVKELVEKGAERAHTAIFAALMSLRKICNHADLMYLPRDGPRLRVPQAMPGYETRSGKLEALGELLEQCREGGHRSLIFCQLTSMLDILGHFLTSKELKYLRIDGETPGTGRQALVDRFNSDPTLDSFLISTRAGGTGLNLTGADTVIFYDHDWNPANDQQAQDRAYRIGQQRAVNVYRLICKGTLEEKILRRQALKKLLAKSIVHHDAAGMKDLSREELLSLFSVSDEKQDPPSDSVE